MFLYLRDIVLSFLSIVFVFAIPGAIVLRASKLKLVRSEFFVLSPLVGMVIITLLAYLLAWMNLRFLLPLIVLFCLVYAYMKRKDLLAYTEKKSFFGKSIRVLLFVMGVIFYIPFISSGDFGSFISLIGVHFQDSSLHVSIINELIRQFPPIDPGFAGNKLMSYHFFYNLSAAIIASVMRISSEIVHFRVMPLLFAFAWPYMTFMVAKRFFKNSLASIFVVFFTMFGASFSCFIFWYYHVPISFNSGLGILQPSGSLLNPPFASSIIVLLLGIYFLYRFEETGNSRLLFLVSLCFGSLVEYKVYAGMTGLAGLGIYTALRLKKYGWKIALSGLSAVLIAFLVYWPFTGTAGYLVYAPLWVTHEIARVALPFLRYDNAIYVYGQMFDPIRPIILEIKLLAYYIIGNFGLRTLGILGFVILLRKFVKERVFLFTLLVMCITSFLIPILFMQSLKPYEIGQMSNYSLFVLSFPTGYMIASLMSNKRKVFSVLLAISVIAMTLPQFPTDYASYIRLPQQTIASGEYATYTTIKRSNTKNGVIMKLPSTDLSVKEYNRWFRSETNMQISAYTHATSFLAFTNIIYKESDVTKRLKIIADTIKINRDLPTTETNLLPYQEKINTMRNIFREYNIAYVVSPSRLDGLMNANLLEFVSEYSSNRMYKVN